MPWKMKNSQIAIIVAIAILIGYSLVRLGNSSTYSSFEDAIALNGEKTTVIGFLDLEGNMDFNPKPFNSPLRPKTKKATLVRLFTTNPNLRILNVLKK